ncbi:MAG TPA: D-arabinono-1,4-lactone oxidase, partial [Polyangiaceae bacterium]|nr:D-arabinono-1,4-lactone oxidase [Polyangiaceae bacterium]
PGARDQVETKIVTAGDIEHVLAACTPPFSDGASRYALLLPQLERGIAYACRYVTGERLQRYRFVHEPRSPLRVLGELTMRSDCINRLTWWLAYHTRAPRYVDPIFDHAFFMDGNVRTHRLGQRCGFTLGVVQQSFLLPVDRASEFLDAARREFRSRSFWPSLADALFSPSSSAVLSASSGLPGLLITFGFESSSRSRLHAVRSALRNLSARCGEMGGRVQLTKSVHASAEDLAGMYAHALPRFGALKQRLDPQRVLRNEFLERVLPQLA